MGCYSHAQARLSENSSLAIGINLEIVESLRKLNLNQYNEMYLKDAIELSHNSLDIRIHSLELLAMDYIDKGNKDKV